MVCGRAEKTARPHRREGLVNHGLDSAATRRSVRADIEVYRMLLVVIDAGHVRNEVVAVVLAVADPNLGRPVCDITSSGCPDL